MKRQGINGDLITKYREQNRLTQAKFATRLNKKLGESGVEATYSDKAISMWENGNRQPADINVIKAIAELLEVTLDELCGNVCACNDDEKHKRKNMESNMMSIDEVRGLIPDFLKDDLDCTLAMFNAGKLIDSKAETIENSNDILMTEIREFWLAITLNPLAEDIVFGQMYYWDNGVEEFEKYTKGAKIVDEREFKLLIYDNAQYVSLFRGDHSFHNFYGEEYDEEYVKKYKDAIVRKEYVEDRFDIDVQITEVMNDFICALEDTYGSYNFENLECNSKNVYYTDKGMIIRMSASITLSRNDFLKMRLDHSFEDDKWQKINEKTIDELLSD